MAQRKQLRVGNQWLYADDAERLLREAIRIRDQEEQRHRIEGHVQPWWKRYVFSTDHKWIGLQYGFTALCFLLFGFCLMILMRLQLGWPGHAFSALKLLGEGRAPGGILLPEAYNQLGAMHGTIMVFLAIVPLAVGAFGNYVVPLQIGAPDMAFPKLNMTSYWCYFVGGVIMLASFAVPGGTANSGWTSYAPLSIIATEGQTWWLFGMVFLITSSLLGSVNFIVTIFVLNSGTCKRSHDSATKSGGFTFRANTRQGIFASSIFSTRLADSFSLSDFKNSHSAPPMTWMRLNAKYL